MSPQCDHSSAASETCAVTWFHHSCFSPCTPGTPYYGESFDGMADLSGGASAVIVPAGAGSGKASAAIAKRSPKAARKVEATTSDSPAEDENAADRVRPCCHNEWVKEGKKRGRLLLRCQVCRAMWKTRPEAHEKCHAFYCGRCKLGDECPYPHIYARQRKAVREADAQEADEVSDPADEIRVAAAPVALDSDEERTVAVFTPFEMSHHVTFTPSTVMPWYAPAEPPYVMPQPPYVMPQWQSDDAAALLPKRDDSLLWDPSSEPTEFDTSAFY
eukprot:TRINITY_DN4748_c0_g1_i2.p1 TRINITY_DN4748_c0_g1~~TRINITY_DN4748_c0_g1_i2.p1  ORF type:complete len:303 (+),score=104.08 TRINITY_DN4748_c0_g1_i2:93-911(+)